MTLRAIFVMVIGFREFDCAVSKEKMSLEELRKQIDEIDAQLVKLLNKRAEIVVEVGKLKNQADKPIYAPDREKEVFAKIAAAIKGRCRINVCRRYGGN